MEKSKIIEVVDKQLEAYNNKDLESFLSCYVDGVMVYSFPSNETREDVSGDAFRGRYEALFNSSPDLHCTLVSRVIKGNIVIDQELVTGFNGGETKKAIAMYEVIDGLINRVWFV